MKQPRFKQYTELALTQKEKEKEKKPRKGLTLIGKVIGFLVVFVILVGVGCVIAWMAPFRNSLSGKYTPPSSRNEINPFSRASWSLAEAHLRQLAADLAWYYRSTASPASSVEELDSAGFRPFLFVGPDDSLVQILSADSDLKMLGENFGLAIRKEGGKNSCVSQRVLRKTTIFGRSWIVPSRIVKDIDPEADTRVHGQFLPDAPQFAEEYVCYLANLWDLMVGSYVAIYHRAPSNLDELLDGLGLKPNPDCVWPLEKAKSFGVKLECGLIDNQISYWCVTLAGGATRGQARYYDTYSTSFDDPKTPAEIKTESGSSMVVDPGLVKGARVPMLTLESVQNLLSQAKASKVETSSP